MLTRLPPPLPWDPVVIIVDGYLQEKELGDVVPSIPNFAPTRPPQGEMGALREAARMLVDAPSVP